MDNLQYDNHLKVGDGTQVSFKPYYKWIIFNIVVLWVKQG